MPRRIEKKQRLDIRKKRLDEVRPFAYTFGVEMEFISEFGYIATAEIIKRTYDFMFADDYGELNLTYEGYNHNDHEGNNAPWKIVSDSSVRSTNRNQQGMELVSPILENQDGYLMLQRVVEVMERLQAKGKFSVNKTCGLHVHLGTQYMTPEEVIKFATNYIRSESAIDLLVPPSRRIAGRNGYCASNVANMVNHTGNKIPNQMPIAVSIAMDNLRTCLRDVSKNATKQDKLDIISQVIPTRFVKLNLSSLHRNTHKTIEVRHFGGSLDVQKIHGWLHTLDYMYRMSRTQVAFKKPESSRNTEPKGNFRRLSAWFDVEPEVQAWVKGRKKELAQADARRKRNARRRKNYAKANAERS